MNNEPSEIFEQFRNAVSFKSSVGSRGIYEQCKINERFYIGDQWHGAKCGNTRPLVRYNIIKRIGDYKMSQILGNPITVGFTAEGVPGTVMPRQEVDSTKFIGEVSDSEINYIMAALGNFYNVTAERVNLSLLNEKMLRNAYITGTGVIYTYWDPTILTGTYADDDKKLAYKGDINCEVLDIRNIYFGDPFTEDITKQPFIIISGFRSKEDVLREASRFGASKLQLALIEERCKTDKIQVLTKLYKEYKNDGSYTIKSVKVTENAVIRKEFDTGLHMYPLAVFSWERNGRNCYGESEITYLIPNQIAINRMITANVWSAMTSGMPMMVVNGDIVPDGITNEPGQVIKVFGSKEDVDGAVKYVTPPDFTKNFDESSQALINNTLTQSGANEVALGDSKADNASALATLQSAASRPLQIIKNRFYSFEEQLSKIWVDFWLTCYGQRKIKLQDNDGIKYMKFDSDRYRNLIINSKAVAGEVVKYSERERINTLISLYEKGVIDKSQLIARLPDEIVKDKVKLLETFKTEKENGNDGI